MKKINKVDIINKLRDRFELTHMDDEIFSLLEYILPVTLVDELLRIPKGQTTTGSAGSRTDTYVVPSGKRWTIINALGSRAVAQAIHHSVIVGGTTIRLSQSAATDSIWPYTPGQPLILDEGDTFQIGYENAGAGNLISYILYLEEDAF